VIAPTRAPPRERFRRRGVGPFPRRVRDDIGDRHSMSSRSLAGFAATRRLVSSPRRERRDGKTTAGRPVTDGLDATLVFVRHGESTAIVEGRFQGHLAVPLSPRGRRQAELVAARLARPHASPALPVPNGLPLEIVHSPLARAAETARTVGDAIAHAAEGNGVALRPDSGLAEIAQGEWEGLPVAEVEARWGNVLRAWRRDPLSAWAPGGESIIDVQERVRPALVALLARLGDGREPGPVDRPQVLGGSPQKADQPWSIVVAHDGVFKITLLTLLDLPIERFWSLPFALCGITIVELVGGRPRLRAHNLTEHLAPLEEPAQEVSEDRERKGAL
jgi:broad specificity phosphatase PhoE